MKTARRRLLDRLSITGLVAGLLMAACARAPELETRTFELRYLEDDVAHELILPYVYLSRPGAPGAISVVDGKLTVRDTPDNLNHIAEVLATYDRPKPMVQLRFQLIEADGSSAVDPAIADIESALTDLFRFQGYRLMDEIVISGTEGTPITQKVSGEELEWAVYAMIKDIRADSRGGSVELQVEFHLGARQVLATSVRLPAGKTAILGKAPAHAGGRTLVLAVRPEITPPA